MKQWNCMFLQQEVHLGCYIDKTKPGTRVITARTRQAKQGLMRNAVIIYQSQSSLKSFKAANEPNAAYDTSL
jgi:hypothetical protein